ncbi:MAG: hypothetical protein KAX20_05445 [Candidatus Omnitrophica bacterium]|nr:hypothetical protein [Candidatus Omnitrophota bacterium]
MIVLRSPRFKKAYKKLDEKIKKQFKQKFNLFQKNPRYPSLRIKKVEKHRNIFEASITKSYRWTFEFIKGGVKLRVIGTHDILKNP